MDIKFVERGDVIKFKVKPRALYTVSRGGHSERTAFRQKSYSGDVIVAPVEHIITCYADMYSVLAGKEDVADFIRLAVLSVEKEMIADGIKALNAGLSVAANYPTQFIEEGAFNTQTAIQLAQRVQAYNYGAKKRERVIQTMKSSILYAVGIMLVGLVVMEIIPAQLIGLFNATDELIELGVPALRIICLSFCFAGFCIVVGSVFQALGNGVYSMIISIARQLCVLLPVAYLLSLSGNVNLIWWSFPIAEIASVTMSTFFLVKINREVISKIGQ